MVRDRAVVIEDGLECHRWKGILAWLLRTDLVVLLVFTLISGYRLMWEPKNERLGTTGSILMLLLAAVSVLILAIAVLVHLGPLRLATAVVRESYGRRRETARLTVRTVIAHLTATTMCAGTTLLSTSCDFYSHLIWAYHPGAADPDYELFKTATFGLDLITNACALLFLSNLIHLPKRKKLEPRKLNRAQVQCAGWERKVAELSARGLPLRTILSFYAGLGEKYMTNYDAEHHTTADVVWQAVIPETAASGIALSTKLMRGRTLPAQRMVTHSWSNKFVNLLAAIIADGLDEPTYEDIAKRLLAGKLQEVTEELQEKGALDVTYWVCAFCINQHASICSNAGCCCEHPKLWNHTPPLREDGESIECELNKFDDMMLCLMTSVPKFSQVIAVDDGFTLFHRAWCVAEIYLAYSQDIPQLLKVPSSRSMNEHSRSLERLCVQEMKASRAEDVAMILSKIQNVADFNKTLRWMILDESAGLLSQWKDAVSLSTSLAKFATRCATLDTLERTF
ncbi:mycA [Symbiodinium sp. CCMP2456]|nr:mycA [Symbiodinium sp. CCMP2456]